MARTKSVNTTSEVIGRIDALISEAESLLYEGQYVLDEVPVHNDIAPRPPHQYIGPEHTQGYQRRVYKASPGQRLSFVALKAGVSMGQLSSYLAKRKAGMSQMRAAVACKMQVLTARDIENQLKQLGLSKSDFMDSVNESRYVHNMEIDPRQHPVGLPRAHNDIHASWGTKSSGTELSDESDIDYIISTLVAVDPESDTDLMNFCDVMSQLSKLAMHSDDHVEIIRVAVDAVQDYLAEDDAIVEDEDGDDLDDLDESLDSALLAIEGMDHGLFEDSEEEEDEDEDEDEDEEDEEDDEEEGDEEEEDGDVEDLEEAFDYDDGEYEDYQAVLGDDSVQFDLYGPEDTTIEGLTSALGRALEAHIPDSQPGRIGLSFMDMAIEGEEAILSGKDSTGRDVYLTVSMPKAMFKLELPEADAYVEMKLLPHHPLSNLSLFLQHIGKMLIHDQYVYSEVEQPKSVPGGDR